MSAIHPEMQSLLGAAALSKGDHDRPRPWCEACGARVDFFLVGRDTLTREWWFVVRCHGAAKLVRPQWGDHAMIDEPIFRMIRVFKRGAR